MITDDMFTHANKVKYTPDELEAEYRLGVINIELKQLKERMKMQESRACFLFAGNVIALFGIICIFMVI